jgi:uracil-DNA glycosylase
MTEVHPNIEELRAAASVCTACDLYERATQTVFGEGPPHAALMLVGEQPGDREDEVGKPFVGPAGQLLDRALAEAGIDRAHTYVTNAVKHFKWKPAGKVRLHQKPNAREIRACSQWWRAELEAVRPSVVVLLGATAAQAILGPAIRVTRDRGQILPLPEVGPEGPVAIVTTHPAAILRMREPDRGAEFAELVHDLALAVEHLESRIDR